MDRLGKLTQVNDLREIWNHEAYDFTQWLAKDENMKLLGEELGINIEVREIEANSGRYNVDILAIETDTNKKIVIENQLENTNHDHLGKLLVYASGHDAQMQIWVVKNYHEEHKQAVDWLNEHGDDSINIFLVKIELWKIDDSNVAPKFNIISSPNNWKKAISSPTAKNNSKAGMLQYKFWEGFIEYCSNKSVSFNLVKPQAQNWMDINIGGGNYYIVLRFNTLSKVITCELYIPDNKDLFNKLSKYQCEINNIISNTLFWKNEDSKKMSNIQLKYNKTINTEEDWENSYEWLLNNINLFKKVFAEYTNK